MTWAVRYCNGNTTVSCKFSELNIKSWVDFLLLNPMHFFGYLLPCGPRHTLTRFLVWVGKSGLQGHQAWWVCMVSYILYVHDEQAVEIFWKSPSPKQPNVEVRKQYLFGEHPHFGGSRNKILMNVDSSGILQWLIPLLIEWLLQKIRRPLRFPSVMLSSRML